MKTAPILDKCISSKLPHIKGSPEEKLLSEHIPKRIEPNPSARPLALQRAESNAPSPSEGKREPLTKPPEISSSEYAIISSEHLLTPDLQEHLDSRTVGGASTNETSLGADSPDDAPPQEESAAPPFEERFGKGNPLNYLITRELPDGGPGSEDRIYRKTLSHWERTIDGVLIIGESLADYKTARDMLKIALQLRASQRRDEKLVLERKRIEILERESIRKQELHRLREERRRQKADRRPNSDAKTRRCQPSQLQPANSIDRRTRDSPLHFVRCIARYGQRLTNSN